MTYTYEIIETNSSKMILRSDGTFIPFNEDNSDYQQYLNPTEHLQTIVPMEGAN